MSNNTRRHYRSGAKWESIVGYSRAIRINQTIEVSGTCAVDKEGVIVGAGQPYLQTKRILEIIRESIEALGGSMDDVVRTRIYVTNIADWQEIGNAHGEVFSTVHPVTTMVEVSKLIAPEYLVEIEATAIVPSPVNDHV